MGHVVRALPEVGAVSESKAGHDFDETKTIQACRREGCVVSRVRSGTSENAPWLWGSPTEPFLRRRLKCTSAMTPERVAQLLAEEARLEKLLASRAKEQQNYRKRSGA